MKRGLLLLLVLAFAAPLAASAGGDQRSASPSYLASSLATAAEKTPGATVPVVVQSVDGAPRAASMLDRFGDTSKRLDIVRAAAGTIQAGQLSALAKQPGLVITPDIPVVLSSTPSPAQQLITLGSQLNGLHRGLAGALLRKLVEARKQLAKPSEACKRLDEFNVRLVDELSKPNAKVTTAPAGRLLQGANGVEQSLGCLTSGANAEDGLVELLQAIDGLGLTAAVDKDFSNRVTAILKKLVSHAPDNGCKELADLARAIQDASANGKLTGTQGLKLSTTLSQATTGLCGGALPDSGDLWTSAVGVDKLWPYLPQAGQAPTIAFVDSGIEPNRPDFGNRVLAQLKLNSLPGDSAGDGNGHGTFVAGLAAGASAHHVGAAPTAGIVSLDVMDDQGMARTSEVIAAAQWILKNHRQYNIRVANFSLHSASPSSFRWDPLDKAVEKLWFAGVVVVAASGNEGNGGKAVPMAYAPANDPFAITVGALDLHNSTVAAQAEVPSWSSWGYTLDGFAKPEVSAPGRNITGPVPAGSTLARRGPGQVTTTPEGTYMKLSGTSASTPIVAGIAADLLTFQPSLTPDQVKGALMLSAQPLAKVKNLSGGVGEVSAQDASNVASPPNPNLALNRFLVNDPQGNGKVFDDVSWFDVIRHSPAWDQVSWSDGWSNSAWSVVSWSDVSWSDVSWSDVSWSDVSWSDVSWADVSWADSVYADVDP